MIVDGDVQERVEPEDEQVIPVVDAVLARPVDGGRVALVLFTLTDEVLSVVCDALNSVLPRPSPTVAVTSTPAWNELSIETVVPVVLPLVYWTIELLLPPLVPGGAYSTVRRW